MSKHALLGVLALAGVAGAANAEVIASFSLDDLDGSFNLGTGVFTATAVDTADLRSSGDVSRLINPMGTAFFDPGFVSGADSGNFAISMNVNVTGPNSATATGAMTLTDADGDTVTANISGNFGSVGPGFIFFSGTLSGFSFNDLGTADGTFNGSSGGSFNSSFDGGPFDGAVVQIIFGGTTFFTEDFGGRAVGVSGQVVPTPGALALLGLGGLAMARRRR